MQVLCLLVLLLASLDQYASFTTSRLCEPSRLVAHVATAECDLATEGTIECDEPVALQPIPKPAATVWQVFGDLAAKTKSVNLGQGFPDWSPPDFILEALREVVSSPYHQYTRPAGHPPLVELIGARYSKHLDRVVDPFNEVAITVGASQALFLSLMTFTKPGDEVVMFEPFFELYLKQLKLTAATPVFVPLGGRGATREDPWALDVDVLRGAITKKTKVLILNSPHNPTGKVFTLPELEAIAQVVRENPNIIVLSDEVYKFSVYNALDKGDSSAEGHYHFARIKDMFDRTITLSSCGKTFSVTGWQVGWAVGPSVYIRQMQDMLPCLQFCSSTPIQHALTLALQVADLPYEGFPNYYSWLRAQFQRKRSILEEGLAAVGIEPLASSGGFFLMGKLPYYKELDVAGAPLDEPYDWRFCRMMAERYGISAIPASPFFSTPEHNAVGPMARFAFCKKDETLVGARDRLLQIAASSAYAKSKLLL